MYFPNKREILIYNWLEIFIVNVKVYGPIYNDWYLMTRQFTN